jgi:hypothetical protein
MLLDTDSILFHYVEAVATSIKKTFLGALKNPFVVMRVRAF